MNILELSLKKVVTVDNVVTCLLNTSLGSVINTMNENNIGSICIVDSNGLPAGIFTERDFLKRIGTNATAELFTKEISEFMTSDPVTAKEETKIRDCFGLMRMGKFRHVIIVDDAGIPKRMLSIRDAFYFLCDAV